MLKYKPMLVRFDEEGYNLELKQAQEKIQVYKEALVFAQQNIIVEDYKNFGDGFSEYFKHVIYESNKGKIELDINVTKLLDLLDIDISLLVKLERMYDSNSSVLSFDEPLSIPTPLVDRKKHEVYTTSAEQNEALRDGRRFIDAIQQVSKHTTVFPFNMQSGTGNFIAYDVRRQEYFVNLKGR